MSNPAEHPPVGNVRTEALKEESSSTKWAGEIASSKRHSKTARKEDVAHDAEQPGVALAAKKRVVPAAAGSVASDASSPVKEKDAEKRRFNRACVLTNLTRTQLGRNILHSASSEAQLFTKSFFLATDKGLEMYEKALGAKLMKELRT